MLRSLRPCLTHAPFYPILSADAPVFRQGGRRGCRAPKFCGFSNSITHGSITNIVYFAVVPELRSRGYGSQILQVIHEQHPDTRIVVDIEVEEDSKNAEELERRNRRREFYQRNGFDAFPVDYVWQGEHYRLLSAGGPVTEKEFRYFWKEILKDIPGAKHP